MRLLGWFVSSFWGKSKDFLTSKTHGCILLGRNVLRIFVVIVQFKLWGGYVRKLSGQRGALCQPLIYCVRAPNLPYLDLLNIFPLPAGTLSVHEATGGTLPEEGIFPPGSVVSCWWAPAVSVASEAPSSDEHSGASTSPSTDTWVVRVLWQRASSIFSWTTFPGTLENTFPAHSRGLIFSKIYWCDTAATCLPLVRCGWATSCWSGPLSPGSGRGTSLSPVSQPRGKAHHDFHPLLCTLWKSFTSFSPVPRYPSHPHLLDSLSQTFPCLNYNAVSVPWLICNWDKTMSAWGEKNTNSKMWNSGQHRRKSMLFTLLQFGTYSSLVCASDACMSFVLFLLLK